VGLNATKGENELSVGATNGLLFSSEIKFFLSCRNKFVKFICGNLERESGISRGVICCLQKLCILIYIAWGMQEIP
jgi:hypothetical protein